MESASKLVVDAAAAHLFQRALDHGKQMFFPAGLIAFEQQLQRRSVRELGRLPEAPVAQVEHAHEGILQLGQRASIEAGPRACEAFRLRYGLSQGIGGFIHLGAAVLVGISNRQQNALESRPAHGVLRREVGSSEERPPVRGQEAGQRPAALPGDSADRGLIAGVHVRALVAVHLHRHEKLIDERRDFSVLIAFAVDDVAPVAPHRADVEQDGLVFGAGTGKGFFAPLVPGHRLMRGRAQVGTCGLLQAAFSLVGHKIPFV